MNERVPALGYVAFAAAALTGSPALAETVAGANVTVTAGYSSNSQLQQTDTDTAAASGTVTFAPTVTITGALSRTTLGGSIRHIAYASKYSDQTDYSAALAFTQQLSPRSSAGVSAGFSQQSAIALSELTPIDPTNPNQPPDPGLVAQAGGKTRTFSAGGDFSTQLSSRLSLSVTAGASRLRYSGRSLALPNSNYDSYRSGITLLNQVTSRLSLGVALDASKTDYSGVFFGDSQQATPTLVADLQLAPDLRLSAHAGVSLLKTDAVPGLSIGRNSTNFSGNISLCRVRDRGTICGYAGQSVLPTSFAGVSKVTSAAISYSYATSLRGNFSLNVNYSKSSAATQDISNVNSYLSGSAGYRHQLGRRLSAVANAQYTNPIASTVSRKANFYGNIGISYRLGRSQ